MEQIGRESQQNKHNVRGGASDFGQEKKNNYDDMMHPARVPKEAGNENKTCFSFFPLSVKHTIPNNRERGTIRKRILHQTIYCLAQPYFRSLDVEAPPANAYLGQVSLYCYWRPEIVRPEKMKSMRSPFCTSRPPHRVTTVGVQHVNRIRLHRLYEGIIHPGERGKKQHKAVY